MTVDTPAAPAETPVPDPPSKPETNPVRVRVLMGRYTGPRDTEAQLRLAAALARARTTIPQQYRDNPGDILSMIMQAQALDIELAVAMDNIVFSDAGVGGMRARLMHALLIRAGHEVRVTHHDDRLCRMLLIRGDGRRGGGAQWSLAEATNAGLLIKKGSPWKFYGEDMLWARCLSRLARRYAPEVVSGFYAAEEMDGIPDDALDSDDLSTAMRDQDGDLVPAPDVEELLKDIDSAGVELLRKKWREAREHGLMGAYAGTVDRVDLSVRDLLYARMADAQAAEARQQQADGVVPQDLSPAALAASERGAALLSPAALAASERQVAERAAEVEAVNLADAEQARETNEAPGGMYGPPAPPPAPAVGTGQMTCGCRSVVVLAADGKHEDGCTRPPRRSAR